jgi:hypothetical protein
MSGCGLPARTGGAPKEILRIGTVKLRAFSFNNPWRSTSRRRRAVDLALHRLVQRLEGVKCWKEKENER